LFTEEFPAEYVAYRKVWLDFPLVGLQYIIQYKISLSVIHTALYSYMWCKNCEFYRHP